MVLLFYITYINVDLAHHKIFRAKVGKGGIKGGGAAIGSLGKHNFISPPAKYHLNGVSSVH